jgi:hypothetical protein
MVGPRVFTAAEAAANIPALEKTFTQLDRLKERLKNAKIRVNALELIWGESLQEPTNADYHEYTDLMKDLKETTERFNAIVEGISELGGVVKGVEPGLVDFYGVHDGHLVFLCWKRGETEIRHWHHVDAGYADRQPFEADAE